MTPIDKPGPIDPRYAVTECLTCHARAPGTLPPCDCERIDWRARALAAEEKLREIAGHAHADGNYCEAWRRCADGERVDDSLCDCGIGPARIAVAALPAPQSNASSPA